jgi:hypothetical protein
LRCFFSNPHSQVYIPEVQAGVTVHNSIFFNHSITVKENMEHLFVTHFSCVAMSWIWTWINAGVLLMLALLKLTFIFGYYSNGLHFSAAETGW